MTSKDYLALVDVAQSLIATHVPNMAYRVPGDNEQYSGNLLVDGSTSGAIDMLSPALRSQFEDLLGDACHFLSMTFEKALPEAIDDPREIEDGAEAEEDEDNDDAEGQD